MREKELARAGTFCPNPDCPDGKVNHGNLINYGWNRAGTPVGIARPVRCL